MLQVTLLDELGEWVVKNAAPEGFDSVDALVAIEDLSEILASLGASLDE